MTDKEVELIVKYTVQNLELKLGDKFNVMNDRIGRTIFLQTKANGTLKKHDEIIKEHQEKLNAGHECYHEDFINSAKVRLIISKKLKGIIIAVLSIFATATVTQLVQIFF